MWIGRQGYGDAEAAHRVSLCCHPSGKRILLVDGNTIRLEGMGGGPTLYRVGENQLTQLGMDGKPVTGPLAARFILKKLPKPR